MLDNQDLYADPTPDIVIQKKMQEVEGAIAQKNQETGSGVGKYAAQELGLEYLERENLENRLWYEGLGLARTDEEKKLVINAIKEWADGELIVRHIGYGMEYICCDDFGITHRKKTNSKSIFDEEHREWLCEQHGVKFLTSSELLEKINILQEPA